MPYSQILALIVALSLIVGAPSEPSRWLDPPEVVAIWFTKTIFWYVFCFLYALRSKSAWRRLPDRILWLSIALLFMDLFALNLKWYFPHPRLFQTISTLNEGIGLFIYFLYILIGWSAIWRASPELKALFPELEFFIKEKARLLLPALVPYLIAGIISDILRLIHVPYSEFLFSSIFLVCIVTILPIVTCRIWGCIPLPASPLRDQIENFLSKGQQSVKEIMLWPAEGLGVCTAAVLGILPKFRYVLLTPCLLRYLTIEEIKAVLAHEMEHIRRRHMVWYMIFLIAYAAILYRLVDPLWTWLLTRKGFLEFFIKVQDDAIYLAVITIIPFTLSFLLYFRFVLGYFMRNFEREADSAIFSTDGNPVNLISALEKVAYLAGDIRDHPNWHHYSIKERVDFLKASYHRPELLNTFKRRLAIMRTGFLVVTAILIMVPSLFPKDIWLHEAKENLTTIIVEQMLKRNGESPGIYAAIGELFLEKGDYKKAEYYFKKALELAPNSPELLNNLAWIYATSKDPVLYRPHDALRLAKKAFAQKKAPYIIDTLAEAYFINGYIKEAILLEKQALSLNPPRRGYYEGQLRRFMQALSRHQQLH